MVTPASVKLIEQYWVLPPSLLDSSFTVSPACQPSPVLFQRMRWVPVRSSPPLGETTNRHRPEGVSEACSVPP